MNDLEDRIERTLAAMADATRPSAPPIFSWQRPARRGRVAIALKLAFPAAAAAVVATVIAAGASRSGNHQHARPTPKSSSNTVKAVGFLVPGTKTPMLVGQYFYSRTVTDISNNERYTIERWQPIDAAAKWTIKAYVVDGHGKLIGKVRSATVNCTEPQPVQTPSPRGELAPTCPTSGDWTDPTPEFLRSLPLQPKALYAKLHRYVLSEYKRAEQHRKLGSPKEDIASVTIDFIHTIASQTQAMSQPVSAALQQAAALVPGVVVKPASNLTGVHGTGYEIDAPNGQVAGPLIFDADGNYVGTPDTAVSVGSANSPGGKPTHLTH